MRRFLTPLLAALALTATAAPSAHAVDLDAPYTQASAVVDGNGNILDSKMIVNTWRAGTGQYCVQVDPLVDVSTALVQVTPGWAGSAASRKPPHSICGSRANTIPVWVWDLNGNLINNGLTIAVL